MPQTEIAVIGAGPYGLSIAAHLRAAGANYRIFGQPMQTWSERMPAGMMLKSDPFASNLYDPAARFTLAEHQRRMGGTYDHTAWLVPLETFVAYGRWFQTEAVPDLDPRDVARLEAADGGFRLTLIDGETLAARKVVVAAGIREFAHLPDQFSGLPPELVSHSSQVGEPARFAGKDVTVLGSGASALDLAALLGEAGASPRLLARAAELRYHAGDQGARSALAKLRRPTTGVGPGWKNLFISEAPGVFAHLPEATRLEWLRTVLGPSAGRGVRHRIEGKIPALVSTRIARIEPKRGRLRVDLETPSGAQTLETDHLIAATGYRPDISRMPFLDRDLVAGLGRVGGAPQLGRDFQSTTPGLYFVGLAAAHRFGPVQRFAYGARFAARTVSRALAR